MGGWRRDGGGEDGVEVKGWMEGWMDGHGDAEGCREDTCRTGRRRKSGGA